MEELLTRQAASEAVQDDGWRYLLGALRTSVAVDSPIRAVGLIGAAVEACGENAAGHLGIDLRTDRVEFTVQSLDRTAVTVHDVELAHRISDAVRAAGLEPRPGVGTGEPRSVQRLEIAVDALDIPAIRPFWKAVFGYQDEPGSSEPTDAVADPYGQGPTIWFQQMGQPRPQRNRIHLDICVPHDEAAQRLAEALAAGGRLVSDTSAPAFWVLADLEGNEICITTWQGRDG